MIDLISFAAVCIACFLVWLVTIQALSISALKQERHELEQQLEQRDSDYWELREGVGEAAYLKILQIKAISAKGRL